MSTMSMSDLPEGLSQLHQFYSNIPLTYLLAGHSLFVASLFRQLRDRFLLSYWVSFAAAFGGGVVSSLLIMDRTAAPIPLFTVNAVGIIWSACWWAMNYCPGDLVYTVYNILPVKMVAKCCSTFLRCSLIMGRVDLAVKIFPGVVAAPLVLGTVGGSAGKFIVDAILMVSGDSRGPSEVSVPSYIWRSGVVGAVGYYLLAHVTQAVTQPQAFAAVLTFFLAHSLTQELVGLPLDFTTPISGIFHGITNIPSPAGVKPLPSVKPVKANAVAAGKGGKKDE